MREVTAGFAIVIGVVLLLMFGATGIMAVAAAGQWAFTIGAPFTPVLKALGIWGAFWLLLGGWAWVGSRI